MKFVPNKTIVQKGLQLSLEIGISINLTRRFYYVRQLKLPHQEN
jgi:hypothetical protein